MHVMRTVIKFINYHLMFAQSVVHPHMERDNVGFGEFAFCHAGLVGDDYKQVAPFHCSSAKIKHRIVELDVFGKIRIGAIDINNAIAVEKESFIVFHGLNIASGEETVGVVEKEVYCPDDFGGIDNTLSIPSP